jgi:hypothetical protein
MDHQIDKGRRLSRISQATLDAEPEQGVGMPYSQLKLPSGSSRKSMITHDGYLAQCHIAVGFSGLVAETAATFYMGTLQVRRKKCGGWGRCAGLAARAKSVLTCENFAHSKTSRLEGKDLSLK